MIRITVLSVLTIGCMAIETFAEDPVHFADSKLKSKVEAALGIMDPTPTDMLSLTSLTANFGGYDIAGLEYAVNLETLFATDSRLTDLSPLSGLSNLRRLDLSDNYVLSDLSGLSGCTSLDYLDVHRNAIWDLRPLSGLTGLRTLIIRNNYVSNIRPLSGLTNLESLNAGNLIDDSRPQRNTISSIAALTSLTSLKALQLQNLPLSGDAYWDDLQKVFDNNPRMELGYDPNTCPPTGVSASDGSYPDRVHVTWNVVRNGPKCSTRYRVYRAPSAADPKVPISGWQMDLSLNDMTAQPGMSYVYWVRAAPCDGSEATDFSSPDTGWW